MNIDEKKIRCLATDNVKQANTILYPTENRTNSCHKNNSKSNNIPTETLLAMQKIEKGMAVKRSKIIDLELP